MEPSKPVSEDDVRACYRLLLGREPENNDVVARHIREGKTLSGLRARMLASPEFLKIAQNTFAKEFISRAPTSKITDIETGGSSEKLHKLFNNVQRVWAALGESEPHFSVLSDQRFKPGSIKANEEVFYKSGSVETQHMLARLTELGLQPRSDGTALELGCGVGRVTRHLAEHFKAIKAYDVSPRHIDLARNYMNQQKVKNVEFLQLSSISGLTFPSHDFFYSRIVLQHNPPPVIKFILDRVLQAIRPGGIAVFQLLTSKTDYSFYIDGYIEKMNKIDDQELHVLPQSNVFELFFKYKFAPVEVYRDTSVGGRENVSSTFIGRRNV